ncbi:MAG: carbonic anhydrase [Bythopirellula sp.]
MPEVMHLPPLELCQQNLPADEFGTTSQLLNEIGQGDDAVAVMLTCWELGFAPDRLSHANPGEIMVFQNPGGLVPSEDTNEPSSFLDSIFFGLASPKVRHLIVCGHSQCKTLQLIFAEEQGPKANPFHALMHRVRERFEATYNVRPARDWPCIVAQENILQQLANLRSHTSIPTRLREGTLLLHGWIRDDQSSAIAAYDPVAGQFCR